MRVSLKLFALTTLLMILMSLSALAQSSNQDQQREVFASKVLPGNKQFMSLVFQKIWNNPNSECVDDSLVYKPSKADWDNVATGFAWEGDIRIAIISPRGGDAPLPPINCGTITAKVQFSARGGYYYFESLNYQK